MRPASTSYRLSLPVAAVCSVALVWTYAFHVMRGFEGGLRAMVLTILLAGVWKLYRSFHVVFDLSRLDLGVLLALLFVNVAIHPGLLDPLGGDELYHAEHSVFPLMATRSYVLGLPVTQLEQVRQSMWHLLDLQHVAVVDVWQWVSFGLLALGVVSWFAWARLRGASRTVRWVAVVTAYAVLLGVGQMLAAGPSEHPPLRLLPLFLGQLLFGLHPLACRLPGILTVTLAAFALFRILGEVVPSLRTSRRVGVALLSCFVPIVIYVGDAVEPSVFGYAAAVGTLLLLWWHIRTGDATLLVSAGVLVGIMSLARHTALIWWVPIAVVYLTTPSRFQLRQVVPTFFPALFVLPYLRNASLVGHGAVQPSEFGLLERLGQALHSDVAIMSVVNTTTLPWLVLFCCAAIAAVLRAPRRELLLFLSAVPVCVLFHAIWPYLWGLGRYQAEYVAPFGVFAFVLCAVHYPSPRSFGAAVALCVPAMLGSLQTVSFVPLDARFDKWPQMRISSSARFPYDEAFSFVQRREVHGRFAVLGGSPWYWDYFQWAGGMSFDDVRQWNGRQSALMRQLDAVLDRDALAQLCRELDIEYLIVQTGTRRELQHRSPAVERAIELLQQIPSKARYPFSRVAQFRAARGGDLDLYSLKQP